VTIRITIRDADTGSKIEMDLEPDNTAEDVIESATSYWDKDAGAYILKFGKEILRGRISISDIPIGAGDMLELIPDPEGGLSF
jgi:hypothetical protein